MNKQLAITNKWFVFFALLTNIKLHLYSNPVLSIATISFQIIIVAMAVLIILKTMKINRFLLFLIANFGIVLLSSLVNGTLTVGIVFSIISYIGLAVYLSYCFSRDKNSLRGLYYLAVLLIFVNLIYVFINFGNPVGGTYLFGGKNQLAIAILPLMAIIIVYSIYMHGKVAPIAKIFYLVGAFSIAFGGSGTGILIATLSVLFIFIPKIFMPSLNKMLVIYAIGFIAIILFRVQETIFYNFVVEVLGKNVTFTGRVYIWDIITEKFDDSIFSSLLGYGRGNNVIADSMQHVNFNEAHNGFLQIILDTGIIGLISFLMILVVVNKSLNKSDNKVLKSFLTFFIISFLIIGIAESILYTEYFLVLLLLAYYINIFTKTESNKNIQIS